MNDIIYKTVFGSKLFGTALPTSDSDFKGVFVPDAESILKGQNQRVIYKTTGTNTSKNSEYDVDEEYYSLTQYLKYLSDGQTNAIDILFSTPKDHNNLDWRWKRIIDNKNKILTRNSNSVIRYCLQQTKKYNNKIERFQILKKYLHHMKDWYDVNDFDSTVGDWVFGDPITSQNLKGPYYNLSEEIQIHPDGKTLPHVNICETRVPWTLPIKDAIKIYQKMYDSYGHRAQNANGTIDWKSLYHAYRIADEGIELFSAGEIIFPRPNANYLIKIRTGQEDFTKVSEEVVNMVEKIKTMTAVLPEKPDEKWIDDFILEVHTQQVKNYLATKS